MPEIVRGEERSPPPQVLEAADYACAANGLGRGSQTPTAALEVCALRGGSGRGLGRSVPRLLSGHAPMTAPLAPQGTPC